jgi:anaerobic ribonucleoside-triphosphate reductase
MGTPVLINSENWWLKDGYLGSIFSNDYKKTYLENIENPDLFNWEKNYVNLGGLQSISINFPRIAFEANGNDDRVFQLLGERMDLSRDILLLKYKIIETLLKNGRLPLCNESVDNQALLDLNRQALLFGYIGLDEMVKVHTNYHLHEDNSSLKFGMKVLRFLIERTQQYTTTHNKFFTVWEEPAEFATHRFALLDLTHYPTVSKPVINGNVETDSVYYTPAAHGNYALDIPLSKRSDIHTQVSQIVQNNTALPIWLSESPQNENVSVLKDTTLSLLDQGVNVFSYNFDFYSCPQTGYFKKTYPADSQDHVVKRISKITNYYAPLELWNVGKKQEYEERKRITL